MRKKYYYLNLWFLDNNLLDYFNLSNHRNLSDYFDNLKSWYLYCDYFLDNSRNLYYFLYNSWNGYNFLYYSLNFYNSWYFYNFLNNSININSFCFYNLFLNNYRYRYFYSYFVNYFFPNKYYFTYFIHNNFRLILNIWKEYSILHKLVFIIYDKVELLFIFINHV